MNGMETIDRMCDGMNFMAMKYNKMRGDLHKTTPSRGLLNHTQKCRMFYRFHSQRHVPQNAFHYDDPIFHGSPEMTTRIRAGTLLTCNPAHDILRDALITVTDGAIASVTPAPHPSGPGEIDASRAIVMPGFIQTHIHLCQTLFRGRAENLPLLQWLRDRIFPFEASHSASSMYQSARVGIAELIRSGTTTILDMGSIHHQEEIIRAIGESGLRACVGKALMDVNDIYPRLRESSDEAIASTRLLAERWHGSYDGRIRYAVAPRFVLSCSDRLLSMTAEMMDSFPEMILHTHASENDEEIRAVRDRCGMENIEFLHRMRLLSRRSALAHCIHLNDRELSLLADTSSNVTHCPSSNLKLASGIAPIPSMQSRGINVSLGADGAPCNNSLDMFQEMRLACLIQKPIHGSLAMPARLALRMATIGGATTLGLQSRVGSIEPGKRADLIILDLNSPANPLLPEDDIESAIVYSCDPSNVDSVMVEGEWLYRKKEFTKIDPEDILGHSRAELQSLLQRMDRP